MEGLGTFLLFAVIFFLMMRFGCGAHAVHGRGGHHHDSDGPDHTDPVCGKKVRPEEGYGLMYRGKLVRFCSRECLDSFEESPSTYLEDKT